MLNTNIFPSKRLAFYLARMFLVRSLAVLAALVLILQALDLLGESGKILRFPGNGDAELWHYVSLRLPQLVARLVREGPVHPDDQHGEHHERRPEGKYRVDPALRRAKQGSVA